MNWKPIAIEDDPDFDDMGRKSGFVDMFVSYDTAAPIYIARRKMLFGYRLTAGFVSQLANGWGTEASKLDELLWGFYVLDICCGEHFVSYSVMFGAVKLLIEQNPRDDPFKDIPRHSAVRPWFNDHRFIDDISRLLDR